MPASAQRATAGDFEAWLAVAERLARRPEPVDGQLAAAVENF